MDIWEVLKSHQNEEFYTIKKLPFTYVIKGNEMFISRKDKSITYSTVKVFYEKVMNMQEQGITISGPKQIGTFGSTYLYPIFVELKIIKK